MERINIKYGYPENLLRAIDGDSKRYFTEEQIEEILSNKERLISIEYVVNTMLPERESDIIRLYYKEKLTYDKIGKVYSLSKDRVRQILNKAIRRLKHPVRYKIIIMGLKGYHDFTINQINNKNKEEISQKDNTINQFLNSSVKINIDSFNTTIFDYAIKIPTREYNCLVRSNKTTVWSLFLSTDYEMLNDIRNFGVHSFDHINNALKLLFGFEFADINDLDGYKNRLSLIKQLGFIDRTKEMQLLSKFYHDHDKSVMFKGITTKKPVTKYSGGDFDGDVL